MRSRGFTLIELLVVMAIIGILAAIAIPQFATYKQQSWDAAAKSLTLSLFQAEEAYYSDVEAYYSCTIDQGSSTCSALPGMSSTDFRGYSALLLPTAGGVIVAACHTQAPHGFAYVTDSGHPFFSGGTMQQINIGGPGSCALSVFAAAGG